VIAITTARLETRAGTVFTACAVLSVFLHLVLVPLLGGVNLRPGPPGSPGPARSVEVRMVQRDVEAPVQPAAAPQAVPAPRAEALVSSTSVAQRVVPASTTPSSPDEPRAQGQAPGENGDDAYLPRSALTVPPVTRSAIVVPYPVFEADTGHYAARLSLFIDETGSVRRVDIETEDLPEPLKIAVRDVFMSAEFQPGEVDGRPVRSRLRVEVNFEGPVPRS
jgi:hypothetical protein